MVFTKISVLVPTRRRLPRLDQMLESYARTTAGKSELVFRIDEDDPESREYLAKTPWPVFCGPRFEGYRSTPQFLKDMLTIASGDVIMVGNDDMIFQSDGWDRKILKEANCYPDGLFNIGISTLNASHFPFSIVSRWVVDALGFVYDPRLFWGDIYLRDIMFAFGRSVMLSEVRIDHNWAGYKPDGTFMEAEQFKQTVGTHAYWEHHALVVQEAIQKLRGVAV